MGYAFLEASSTSPPNFPDSTPFPPATIQPVFKAIFLDVDLSVQGMTQPFSYYYLEIAHLFA